MCHLCYHTPCIPTCPTIRYVACPQYPAAAGATGPQGPTGPTGPTGATGTYGPLNLVDFVTNANLPQTVYTVLGSEDVILVDSTLGQAAGTGDIYLLPASDTLSQRFTLTIADEFGTSGTHDIRLIPDGTDTIDGVNANLSLFLTVGAYGSITLVSNKTTGYKII